MFNRYVPIPGKITSLGTTGTASQTIIDTYRTLVTNSISCEAGSYVVTGTDATLSSTGDTELIAEAGSYVVTGTDATLSINEPANTWFNNIWWKSPFWGSSWWGASGLNVELIAEAGSYLVTGTDATLSTEVPTIVDRNKIRVITYNYTDISELTATPVSAQVQNLKTYDRGKTAEANTSTSGGTFTIDMVMGSAAPVTAVIIGRHNFPIGTTLRIKLFPTIDTSGFDEVHDSGIITIDADTAGSDKLGWGTDFTWGSVVWGADNLSEEFAPKANYVYWVPGIDQVDTQAILSIQIQVSYPDFTLEIGRLIVGEYIQPTYTISYGHGLSWQENTKQYRKEGNTLRSNIALPSRRLEFSLNTINEEDRATLQAGLRNVGLRRDLFISLFPIDTDLDKTKDYSGIVKLIKIPVTSEFTNLYYKSKYIMEEV